MRVFAALTAALLYAPLQCGSEPDVALQVEETPGEALYALAQGFRAERDWRAWRRTLEHLIARYPSSRQAVMAKDDLAREAEIRRPTASASAEGDAGERP